jgi:hypothetical protein
MFFIISMYFQVEKERYRKIRSLRRISVLATACHNEILAGRKPITMLQADVLQFCSPLFTNRSLQQG